MEALLSSRQSFFLPDVGWRGRCTLHPPSCAGADVAVRLSCRGSTRAPRFVPAAAKDGRTRCDAVIETGGDLLIPGIWEHPFANTRFVGAEDDSCVRHR